MVDKNSVALAPPLIQDGNKDEDGTQDGAALRRLSVYSDIDPSLNTTVYMLGVE
jgi:hypothetical protein